MRLKRECRSVLAEDIVIERGSNYCLECRKCWLSDDIAYEVSMRVLVENTIWEKFLTAKIKCSGPRAIPCDVGRF